MLVYTSITNEGLQTNLVTCHLFPVVMTSFNTAASLSLERLVNMHVTRQISTLMLTSKGFAWIGVVEQQLGEKPSTCS